MRIAHLQNTIEEKNDSLVRSHNEIRELYKTLSDLQGSQSSNRNNDQIETIMKAIAIEQETKKMLKDYIAKYEAELKQLQGAEPIRLPSPGMIYYLLLTLFSLFLLFLFLNRCYCLIEHIAIIIM